ncbi:lysophospholipid acyltransferase family protein [Acidisarcina polymorpha]|uniref:lysophospholipid acyltransferase family protein n=1 Tax=Acidisarcina polymorpha TaxID=2211140 RepID=UPI000DEF509C|nr:lysophospholipid acyltransferase family protein [Acidisarcina polymorpha]
MRRKLEFVAVLLLIRCLGWLPRNAARAVGAGIGAAAYILLHRLRRVGYRNLQIAFPQLSRYEMTRLLRAEYRNLGWLLAEFCQMRKYTPENTRNFLSYDGLERYLAARDAGKGVLILTGHLGAWELSSFYHSLMGYPMSMVIRRLDNEAVDRLVNSIRCLHGNNVVHKDDFARGLISAMRQGETVGILMDTNMTPPQGLFVDFFGTPACTASGMARVALKTGAVVLPGFLLWEEASRRYVLHFGEPLELIRTGDNEANIIANTAMFTKVLEQYIRQYPEQWLWLHRRWKTRPEGEPPIYAP